MTKNYEDESKLWNYWFEETSEQAVVFEMAYLKSWELIDWSFSYHYF